MTETIFTYHATISETVSNSRSRQSETVYCGDNQTEAENLLYGRYLDLYKLNKNKIRNCRTYPCLSRESFLHAVYFAGTEICFFDADTDALRCLCFSMTVSMHVQKIYEPNDRNEIADKSI